MTYSGPKLLLLYLIYIRKLNNTRWELNFILYLKYLISYSLQLFCINVNMQKKIQENWRAQI
jgi:hypothetical protein